MQYQTIYTVHWSDKKIKMEDMPEIKLWHLHSIHATKKSASAEAKKMRKIHKGSGIVYTIRKYGLIP
jgi:hypothetical protein